MAKKPSPSHGPATSYVPGTDPLVFAPAAFTSITATLVAFKPELPAYDPKTAEGLLAHYRPRLAAIPPDWLDFPRVDVDAVTAALLGVYALTQYPPVLAHFEAQATAGAFLLENLEHLRALTLVLLHVYRLAETAGALRSGAKVPPALDTESAEVEARMQKVCEHLFSADPQIGPILRLLSPGTGYVDRAYDLLGYADIYEQQKASVSGDAVHYRPTDTAVARKLAAQLLAEVGAAMTPQAREAFDLLQRAWTLLKPLYFEVQKVGLALLRYDPQNTERFPSVYVVGRKGGGRRRAAKEEAAPAAGETGAAAPADAKPVKK